MKEKEGNAMIETRQHTLIEMYHPAFKLGYRDGRNSYFKNQQSLSDKDLVECLLGVIEDDPNTQDKEEWYYAVGRLVGQMSGPLIPRQPFEQDEEARQQRLLARLCATSGEGEQTTQLIHAVITLWKVQDYLASRLDADIYESVLHRDASPRTLL